MQTAYQFCVPASSASNGTGYAPNGNLLSYQDSINGNWSFIYDSLNRVTGAASSATGVGPYQNLSLTMGYDSFGNRQSQTSSQPQIAPSIYTPAPGPNNQITSLNVGDGAKSISYDAAGSITADGVVAVRYDGEGRVCATQNTVLMGTVVLYLYDAEGNRVAKGHSASHGSLLVCSDGGSDFIADTTYAIGPNGEQVSEFAGDTNAWRHTNVFAAGTLIATYDPAGLHFHVDDPLGSRRLQVDDAGRPELQCTNLPFGDTTQTIPQCTAIVAGAADATEHHFTGKERDEESGLDNFVARMYASNVGRWVSADPSNLGVDIYIPQTLNRYNYAVNNPLKIVDRNGLWPTYVHNIIINESLPGLSKADLATVQKASYDTDYVNQVNGNSPQDPESSFVHGMSDGVSGQDPAAAERQGDAFIDKNIQEAQDAQAAWLSSGNAGISPVALTKFGNALHTAEDRTSPAHRGNQPWHGTKGVKNQIGAAQHISRELFPTALQMQAAYSTAQTLFLRTFGINAYNQAIAPPQKACVSSEGANGTNTTCQ